MNSVSSFVCAVVAAVAYLSPVPALAAGSDSSPTAPVARSASPESGHVSTGALPQRPDFNGQARSDSAPQGAVPSQGGSASAPSQLPSDSGAGASGIQAPNAGTAVRQPNPEQVKPSAPMQGSKGTPASAASSSSAKSNAGQPSLGAKGNALRQEQPAATVHGAKGHVGARQGSKASKAPDVKKTMHTGKSGAASQKKAQANAPRQPKNAASAKPKASSKAQKAQKAPTASKAPKGK